MMSDLLDLYNNEPSQTQTLSNPVKIQSKLFEIFSTQQFPKEADPFAELTEENGNDHKNDFSENQNDGEGFDDF